MNRLEAALVDVVHHLDDHRIPYMVIGGFANLHWGRPRLTEVLDVKVRIEELAWPEFLAGLGKRFRILVDDPVAFLSATHVIPLATPTGVRVDLVMASLPYEKEAIGRAATIEVGRRPMRICTAEDLVLHKILSDRGRDRDDVEGVIVRHGAALDRRYLDPKIEELASGLEKPEIGDFYRACLRKAEIASGSRSDRTGPRDSHSTAEETHG